MPTIEISHKDLCGLIGKSVPLKELQESLILYAKGEVDAVQGDTLKVDIKDTNRPDLWSTEGVAREIRAKITKDQGVPRYAIKKSQHVVRVTTRSAVQPLAVCAVAELDIDHPFLSQIVQLQEKIASSFGRKRRELSMGIYDMESITPPVSYASLKPERISFVPLGFTREITAAAILREHPKGKEYGHLLSGAKEYPVWIDANGQILSMPPIINSARGGTVTTDTTRVFIEVTGYSLPFLQTAINVIAAQLLERGATVYSVKTVWGKQSVVTPDFTPKTVSVSPEQIRAISGLDLTDKVLLDLLRKARYDAELNGRDIALRYPAYRQDIMHWRDVAEDVLVARGYNSIEPRMMRISTAGRLLATERRCIAIADIMTGAGFQEILSYTLTNREHLFRRMGLKDGDAAEIENPASANWCVFRTSLLPGLMEFLSHNKHVDYPQHIFEYGDIVLPDGGAETKARDVRTLAAATSDATVNYDWMTSVLQALMRSLGLSFGLEKSTHPSFIRGRVADIVAGSKRIGIIGEISPAVLVNWNLEKPVVAFEMDLDALWK